MKTLRLLSLAPGGVAPTVEEVGLVGIWVLPEEDKNWVSRHSDVHIVYNIILIDTITICLSPSVCNIIFFWLTYTGSYRVV